MGKLDNFFREWVDGNKRILGVSAGMTIVMFLILTWIGANIPEEKDRADIYLWMLLAAAIPAAINAVFEKRFWFFGYVDYGRSWGVFFKALLAGTLFAVLLKFGLGFSFLTPFAISSSTGILAVFYRVVASSYVEEKFFRGWLNPQAGTVLKLIGVPNPNFIGVVASSITFGIFHWSIYGGSSDLILVAALFGFVISVGNYYFKSRGFSIAAHTVNNYLILP